jgi:hypothetical protein
VYYEVRVGVLIRRVREKVAGLRPLGLEVGVVVEGF